MRTWTGSTCTSCYASTVSPTRPRVMTRTSALLIALSACGRVGFEREGGAPSDGVIDVGVDVGLRDAEADGSVQADLIGCSDGVREGFIDLIAHPDIAGCAAQWIGEMSMRAP